MGCLILSDSPPIALVNGTGGSEWLKMVFKFDNLNIYDTLFIQLIVIHEEYKKRGFVDIIRAAFRTVPEVNSLLLLIPEYLDYGKR